MTQTATGSRSRPFEVYRHETLRRQIGVTLGATANVRVRGARPVAILELPADGAFLPGGSLALPGPPRVGGLDLLTVLAAALDYAREAPAERLLIAAHAPGDSALTVRRAAAVRALLRGDRAAFAQLALAHGLPEEWAQLLDWVAETRGWDCAPRAASDAAAVEALDRFRAAAGVSAPAGAPLGAADWGAAFDVLDAALARVLEVTPEALAGRRGGLLEVAGGAVGCADAWAPERVRIREHVTGAAERVDLLFFEEEHVPALACHAGGEGCAWKRCDVYRKARYQAKPLACRPAPFVDPPAPERTVYVLELEEALAFQREGEGVLLQPGAPGDAACLEGIARFLTRCEAAGATQLLVAVHGAADDPLAEPRARNALAFFAGEAAWAAHAKAHATVHDWQRLLKWAAAHKGWGCDPGAIDGLNYGGTQGALRRFRVARREETGEWVDASGQWPTQRDFATFHQLFCEHLAELLGRDPAPLLASFAPLGAGFVACGDAAPPARAEVHHYQSVHAARLELLAFLPAHAPAVLAPPLAEVYLAQRYHAEHVDRGAAHAVHVVVEDGAGRPVGAGPRWELLRAGAPIRAGVLDAAGSFATTVPGGTYEVRIEQPEGAPVRAGAAGPASSGPEPWEGGEGTLEELHAGFYQRRGSYREDMRGFENPHLQRFLISAAAAAGVDPFELEDDTDAVGGDGDGEQTVRQGLPRWLGVFQTMAATSHTWGTHEQSWSRLLGAFYHAWFVEKLYAPAGVAMPANVEYFLQHLGKATPPNNGAATLEEIGGWTFGQRPFAYCASAASAALRHGLAAYGYELLVPGYAPGAPPLGHGCPVDFFQGRKAGEAYRPLPGDVLSVHTPLSPENGHVVTVVWAETDGTRSGSMWVVSGNAGHRAVAVDFVRVADTGRPPPRGHVSVINCSRTSQLQPQTVADLGPAELKHKKLARLPGAHPAPLEPGALAPREAGPDVARLRGLLASGQASSFPVAAPEPATVLRAGLRLVSFRGRLAGADPATTGEEVVLAPGRTLRLEWLVTDYETVTLEPAGLDLTEPTRRGEPVVELDPGEVPPGPGGVYRLVARSGGEEVARELRVRGIVDFRVHGKARPGSPTPRLLRRVMEGGHPRYGTPHYHAAESVGALEGSFQAITQFMSDDNQHWFWGQITPRSDATLSWKVVWPEDDVRLVLTVNREPNGMTPQPAVDVTAATRLEGGLRVGSRDYANDRVYRNWFEADLQLLDGGGATLASALIRLRENYEMPGLTGFSMELDGEPVADRQLLQPTDRPTFRWSAAKADRCGLRIVFSSPRGDVHAVELRSWVRDGEAPSPRKNELKEGSYRLDAGLALLGGGERVARLELFTRFAVVDRREVRFGLPTEGGAAECDDPEGAVDLRGGPPISLSASPSERLAYLKYLTQVDGLDDTVVDRRTCGPTTLLAGIFLGAPATLRGTAARLLEEQDPSLEWVLEDISPTMSKALGGPAQVRADLGAVAGGTINAFRLSLLAQLMQVLDAWWATVPSGKRLKGEAQGEAWRQALAKRALEGTTTEDLRHIADRCRRWGGSLPLLRINMVWTQPATDEGSHWVGLFPLPPGASAGPVAGTGLGSSFEEGFDADAPWMGPTVLYNPWPQYNGFAPVQLGSSFRQAHHYQTQWAGDLEGRGFTLTIGLDGEPVGDMADAMDVVRQHFALIDRGDFQGAWEHTTSAEFQKAGSADELRAFVRLFPGLYGFPAPPRAESAVPEGSRTGPDKAEGAVAWIPAARQITEERAYPKDDRLYASLRQYTATPASGVRLERANGKWRITDLEVCEAVREKGSVVYAWRSRVGRVDWRLKQREREIEVKIDQLELYGTGAKQPPIHDWWEGWSAPPGRPPATPIV